jgi:hypothetical protein
MAFHTRKVHSKQQQIGKGKGTAITFRTLPTWHSAFHNFYWGLDNESNSRVRVSNLQQIA